MKTQAILLALSAAPAVLGHTIFTNLHINGKDQGEGVGVRYRRKTNSNYPLDDLSSKDMACNVGGDTGVPEVLTVPSGAELTFEFKASVITANKPRLEPGHKGPCAVYLKKVDSAKTATGSGDGWFKIYDEAYDSDEAQWCTTKYTPTGMLKVTLPEGLAAGEYLARPELLALHNALEGNPQFFASCMQIKVEGSGDKVPKETVSIPGYVKQGDESVTFSIYNKGKESSYKTPGPRVTELVASAGGNGDADAGAEDQDQDQDQDEEPVPSSSPAPSNSPITSQSPVSSQTPIASQKPVTTNAPEQCTPVTSTVTSKQTVTVYADRRHHPYARRHGLWI